MADVKVKPNKKQKRYKEQIEIDPYYTSKKVTIDKPHKKKSTILGASFKTANLVFSSDDLEDASKEIEFV